MHLDTRVRRETPRVHAVIVPDDDLTVEREGEGGLVTVGAAEVRPEPLDLEGGEPAGAAANDDRAVDHAVAPELLGEKGRRVGAKGGGLRSHFVESPRLMRLDGVELRQGRLRLARLEAAALVEARVGESSKACVAPGARALDEPLRRQPGRVPLGVDVDGRPRAEEGVAQNLGHA